MKLLVRLYTEGNAAGIPAGWPAECKEVDDGFSDAPPGWFLMSLDEFEQIKKPLAASVDQVLQARRDAEAVAMKEEIAKAEAQSAQDNVDVDALKRVYVDTPVKLTDGRSGRLLVDAAGLVHFEQDKG